MAMKAFRVRVRTVAGGGYVDVHATGRADARKRAIALYYPGMQAEAISVAPIRRESANPMVQNLATRFIR